MVRVLDAATSRLPEPMRGLLIRHAEMVKFLVVGGSAFIIDTGIFLGLKSTILEPKPVTAKIISTLTATIYSYIMSRQWSFRTRGGRRGHHEALLFFLVSGLGIVVNTAPLWLSRYGLDLRRPYTSKLTEDLADLVSAQIIGTLVAMVFRWWAFRKFVFPHADARPRTSKPETAADGLAGAAVPQTSGGVDLAGAPATAGAIGAAAATVGEIAVGEAAASEVAGAGIEAPAGSDPARPGGLDSTMELAPANRAELETHRGETNGPGAELRAALDKIDLAAAELLADPWPVLDEPHR